MREYVDENNKYPDGEVKYHVGIDAGADRGRLDYSNSDIYKVETYIMGARKATPSEISRSLGLSDGEIRGIIGILADSGSINIERGKDGSSLWYVEYNGVARSRQEQSLLGRYEAVKSELDRLRAECDSLRRQIAELQRENSRLLGRLGESGNQESHLRGGIGAAALNLFGGSSADSD